MAQETTLVVKDKSLNVVLNMLGIEISFDDQALSRYRVTVSKSFRQPEEALDYLLKDKPFRIEKINHTFIIIPTSQAIPPNPSISSAGERKNPFTGMVTDAETQELLGYATVSLLGEGNRPLVVGATDDKGAFRLSTSMPPRKIKVSFIGYEVLVRDVSASASALGTFPLQASIVPLDETIVTSHEIRPKIDRTAYSITADMRQGVANAEELLSRIPGVVYDPVEGILRVNQSKEVLLLVDGMEQPKGYVRNLSPQRISTVEVIHTLSGRYVSDGYTAIINLILDREYRGYEVYATVSSAANLSGGSHIDRLSSVQPLAGINYTNRKLNLYTTYSYHQEQLNLPVHKRLVYSGVELISHQQPSDAPNYRYERESMNVAAGAGYQLTPRQKIDIQGDYMWGQADARQVHILQRTDIENQDKRMLKNTTTDRMDDRTFIGSASYRGRLNNRLQLLGDLTYNYYYNDIDNAYEQDDLFRYQTGNRYNENKNLVSVHTEGEYRWPSGTMLNTGYSYIWRCYGSESNKGNGYLDYRERRNKAFAYLQLGRPEKLYTRIGFAVEHIRADSQDGSEQYVRFLPYVQSTLKVSDAVRIHAGYTTSQHYPTLYQLSPMVTVIDTFLTQMGNIELKPSIQHQVAVRISLWNRLTIVPMLRYTHGYISELYTEKSHRLYRTFDNMNSREYSLQLVYDQPIGRHLRFRNQLMYYTAESVNAEIRCRPDGWLIDSELNYELPRHSLNIGLGYHRNMRKQVVSQGYQMVDKDNWLLTVSKAFCRKRLHITLSYVPPLAWGVRYDQVRALETSLYNERTVLDLKPYNHLLLLKVHWRFDRGGSTLPEKRPAIRKEEREKRTLELY